MLKKILPLVLLFVGSGVGVGAGMALRPAPDALPGHDESAAEHDGAKPTHDEKKEDHGHSANHDTTLDYVKLNNQFVVPIVKDQVVVALVVLALSIEVPEGNREIIFKREPKLRDSFLQVLFDHANIGGFGGSFTEVNNLAILRNALREVGQKDLGADIVKDVLILEIARQDY